MNKYDIVLVDLNPVKWSEQAWIRPCIILQNDFANKFSKTFVVAIISSIIKDYPHTFIIDNSDMNWLQIQSRIDLLQVRTVDKLRIIKKIWELDDVHKNRFNDKIKVAFWL